MTTPTKVYLVFGGGGYDFDSVWSTKELAQEYADAINTEMAEYHKLLSQPPKVYAYVYESMMDEGCTLMDEVDV